MTTHSDAYFARTLLATLKEHHPELVVETLNGRRIGAGAQRVIQVTHSGGRFAQFPFPPKGTKAGNVHAALYESACSMLLLTPNNGSM